MIQKDLKNTTLMLSMSQIMFTLVFAASCIKQIVQHTLIKPIMVIGFVFMIVVIIGICFEWSFRKNTNAKLIRRLILTFINIVLTGVCLFFTCR